MVRNAAAYEGKQIRVRVAYSSAFEMSAFFHPRGFGCGDKSMVWAEFDASFQLRSKPDIAKRVDDSFYKTTIDANGNIIDQWLVWETEMVVTGIIYKPNGRGYGHTSIYSHKFVVSAVEELGTVKKIDVLKTKGAV